jgi:tryptophan-rich sensory protein
MQKRTQALGLVAWVAVAFAAAAVGAIASVRAAEFYQQLAQPAWAPPAGVFGPVWTVLYGLMAVASWLVWRERATGTKRALALYIVQLLLNALWSWLFFAWHEGRWAFIDVVVLWVFVLLTLVTFWRIRRLAGLLLVPYLLWVSFAAVLAFTIWQRNPDLLS